MVYRLGLFTALWTVPGVAAQSAPTWSARPPGARAVPLAGEITHDARLDEPGWYAATPVTTFAQLDPDEGQEVSERTEVLFVYDDEALIGLARQLTDAYAEARTREDLQGLYADWARTYDADHEKVGFFGHRLTAEVLARHATRHDMARVLDAGAGESRHRAKQATQLIRTGEIERAAGPAAQMRHLPERRCRPLVAAPEEDGRRPPLLRRAQLPRQHLQLLRRLQFNFLDGQRVDCARHSAWPPRRARRERLDTLDVP